MVQCNTSRKGKHFGCGSYDVKELKNWTITSGKSGITMKTTQYECKTCGRKFRKGERISE